MNKAVITFLPLLSASAVVGATCFDQAQAAYGVPADVVRAIAITESGLNAKAVNRNANRTSDYGLMQINESWLPVLSSYGISRRDLDDPCLNTLVGTWILASNAERFGWNWTAIGAYNVGCKNLGKRECEARRDRYARKVYRNLGRQAKVVAQPGALKSIDTNRGAAKDLAVPSEVRSGIVVHSITDGGSDAS
jgi:soluble lytic murein transglycosylase-like protein